MVWLLRQWKSFILEAEGVVRIYFRVLQTRTRSLAGFEAELAALEWPTDPRLASTTAVEPRHGRGMMCRRNFPYYDNQPDWKTLNTVPLETGIKSKIARNIFFLAGCVAVATALVPNQLFEPLGAHTVRHFLFGLGFPFAFVWVFKIKRRSDRREWQASFDRTCVRPFGDGFLLGVGVAMVWSLWNEVIVYWVYNPRHQPDWHHYIADHTGLLVSFLVLMQLDEVLHKRNILA